MNTLFDVEALPKDDSNEWYTPMQYVDAAREVMGGVELDPSSCAAANVFVRAERYYTQEQDGLQQDWIAQSVWVNPPFGTPKGKSNMAMWVRKLMQQYTLGHVKQAVLLCMANTEASWFEPLWSYPVCFPCPRVLFHRPGGKMAHHILGTCFVYFGPYTERFILAFRHYGPVVTPDGVHRLVIPVVQPSLLDEAVS